MSCPYARKQTSRNPSFPRKRKPIRLTPSKPRRKSECMIPFDATALPRVSLQRLKRHLIERLQSNARGIGAKVRVPTSDPRGSR